MTRDSFDHFTPRERGLFADNEQQERHEPSARVTGSSDLVDLAMALHAQTDLAIYVSDNGEESRAQWIPKSQCEFIPTGKYTQGHRKNGNRVQLLCVTVTMPGWMAKSKELL